jgi:regulatory helix-turn-helix LysR family protein
VQTIGHKKLLGGRSSDFKTVTGPSRITQDRLVCAITGKVLARGRLDGFFYRAAVSHWLQRSEAPDLGFDVVEAGSFTAAAKRLGRTTSAIRYAIDTLERIDQ